jgi:hypothetical protein
MPLVEGEDYYWEGALIVFTAQYHLRRGYCCESSCRHCPYEMDKIKQEDKASEEKHEAA